MANYTILLIDYEPRSVERTRSPLIAAGYRVHVASDGLAGMAKFAEIQPDLVLVEAMIPKKHGFEVCQDLKRTPQGKRTPIIIMTSVYKGRKYRSQALHIHQCDEYIEKPIEPEQLVAIVRRFIGQPGALDAAAPQATPAEAPSPGSDVLDPIVEEEIAEIEVVDFDAPEVQASAPSAPPRPSPTPQPSRTEPARAPYEASRAALAVADADVAEIMDRLDAIMSPAPSAPEQAPRSDATVAVEPPPAGEVVSFTDAKRARKRKHRHGKAAAPQAPSPSPSTGSSPVVAVATQPTAERTAAPEPAPWEAAEPAPTGTSPWVWGLLVVVIAAAGYFLIHGW